MIEMLAKPLRRIGATATFLTAGEILTHTCPKAYLCDDNTGFIDTFIYSMMAPDTIGLLLPILKSTSLEMMIAKRQ